MNEAGQSNRLALLRQQAILARFGELALRSDSLDAILTEACRLVGEALGTDLAKVMELQEDGRTLLVRAGVGWKPGVVGVATVAAADNSSEGHALKTGEPMTSHDIETETRFAYPPFLTENGVRAVANVAIIGGQGRPPFGILQIDSRTPRRFTDDDATFLRTYANLLAAAVDRLRVAGKVGSLEADAQARKTAEAVLRQSNEMLEARVAERTRELVEANTRLRSEAAERGRVEEALHQSHKMEALGQLTGGIAHDFNNLLGTIAGSLELLRIRAAQGRTAEFDRHIEAALASTDRAAAMTHRLLAFARRQTLDPKPTDVNRLVGGMQDLFGRTVGPGIRIETELADELWPTLCDPNQLESALLNLVINARDAMPDGGRLVIETANAVLPDRRGASRGVAASDGPPGDYVALSVTDTGVGMALDVLARAFDPFFTTKPIGQGTGLGLSMIQGFVQQSGGHVRLSSEVGRGTTVAVYLPRHAGTATDRKEGTGVDPSQAKASAVVLVVEDEPAMGAIIAAVLPTKATRCWKPATGAPGWTSCGPPAALTSWSPTSACLGT